MEQRRLEGKVAIVTGSGQRIGRATAIDLARQGAQVVIAEINPDRAHGVVEEIGEFGARVQVVETDVKDEASVQNMCKRRFILSALSTF